ncbi:MAG: 3-methyl-2-oxobutanoate hydroxymethyltransferase [Parvularculaceae bacterium]|nr:3-methyl-2-oxobutanoate hydroxymethyltransferase [Parvularculaceae bacterium]
MSAQTAKRRIATTEIAARKGAELIVVEGVAEDLAREITERIATPTIGIGASAACDGQILVTQDMLGLFEWTPKFVKRYADVKGAIVSAAQRYATEVRERRFPEAAQVYRLTPVKPAQNS